MKDSLPRLRRDIDVMPSPIVEQPGLLLRDPFRYTDDVLVGAPFYNDGESREGRGYLYLGSADGLSPVPDWTDEGDQAEARFGLSLSGGDVNGDGVDDLIVTAPLFSNGECPAAVRAHGRCVPTSPTSFLTA